MADNSPIISDEQLAYLNDNVDIVSDIMNKRLITQLTTGKLCVCLSVTRKDYPPSLLTRVNINCLNDQHFNCNWSKLLRQVEAANCAPPIFK